MAIRPVFSRYLGFCATRRPRDTFINQFSLENSEICGTID
ncbi:hypothetical protein T4B_14647 [Trichinella pseudospiralis]|uniref:Uncharacterized protein n=1 Tax=Trichinella pseudospiralis TaxID=6337 RepID=A0A0V1GKN4_TRIPS|nr:hypothetical protein T4B_14647 [Trichinella pseudospiralis]KRZ24410.1 hypothetical protein T4C_5408 [Trichinella pseudospiralis]